MMTAAPVSTMPEEEQGLAQWSAILYLLNLLLLPGIAYLILILIYRRNLQKVGPVCRQHLRQNLLAATISGVLLVVVTGLFVVVGGFDSPWTWVGLILYFVSIHALLVLLGVMALVKASSGTPWHYPLLGNVWK